MLTDRRAGYAPATERLAADLAAIAVPCVGCKDCAGFCEALLDACRVPEIVLKKAGA